MADLTPLDPHSKPSRLGTGNVRADDRRGGSGGGGRRHAHEEEPPYEEEEEKGRLDGDSLSFQSKVGDLDGFLADKLPWEAEEEARQRRLQALKGRTGPLGSAPARPGTGPLGAGPTRAGTGPLGSGPTRPGTGPLGSGPARSGTGPLGAPPRTPGPIAGRPPELSPAAGRRVEGGYDPTAAIDRTLSAYEQLRDRQEPTPQEAPRPKTAPLPPLRRVLLGEADPAPEPLAEPPALARPAAERPARPPEPASRMAPAESPAGAEASCQYRVIDGASGQALAGARFEFSPTYDDMLPVIHGQADREGWYRGTGLMAGHYEVTVRHPGYMPQSQARFLQAGETDQGLFVMARPGS